MIRVRMPAAAVGLILGGALVAGCGGSSTNISASGFLSKCAKQNGATSSVCHCLQHKLVAQGFGNFNYNLKSTPAKVKQAALSDVEACGGASTSGTGTST